MMVPAFVVERLLKASRRRAQTNNDEDSESMGLLAGETESQLSGNSGATAMTGALSTMSSGANSSDSKLENSALMGHRTLMKSDAAHAMLTRRSEQVWPYPRSVVMFVSFAPPVLTYEAISDTVTRIEAVARGRSIQKVKTIGTTVLLVAGIDGSLQFEDAAVNGVEAALEIQRRVFPARQAEGWWHRVGVHSGPIFGAVIGSQGLAFDIYGDTVTTAAAVAGSAPENSVRCTGAVRQVLPMEDADLGFVLAAQPLALEIRGKGAIQVFGVHERAVGAAGPRPPGAIGPGSGKGSGDNNSPRSMPSSDSDERVPGSVIADSIRSSLRSAAMLPSAAAPVDGLLESGFMSVDGAAGSRFPGDDDDGAGGDEIGKGFTPTDERTSVSERRTSSIAGTEVPAEQPPAAPSACPPAATARSRLDDSDDDGFGGPAAAGGGFAYDDEIDGFSDED
jgi:class 3 adenylate cyclase